MATTPLQPTLPAEELFTDAEFAYIEESPPGLFPENQNSNFGLKRKIFSDRIQELIEQQNTIYNEMFVKTASQFLDEWEREYGLPVAPTNFTIAQRRSAVLNRILKGPFTDPRRRRIIENYIGSTFGTVIQLTPDGVPMAVAGVPLFSEAAPLSTLYSVRDNGPYGRNLLGNGSFENNTTGWNVVSFGGTLTRSTARSKFGIASGRWDCTNGGATTYAGNYVPLTGATAGRVYSASVWIRGEGSSIGKHMTLILREGGGATGLSETYTPIILTGGWQQITATRTFVQNDRTEASIYLYGGVIDGGAALVPGDFYYFDGAQIELSSTPHNFVDPEKTPFFYEVRIKNTITPDMAGLLRELMRITPAGITFDLLSVDDI